MPESTTLSRTAPHPPASFDSITHAAVDLARLCLGMEVAFISEFKDGRRIFREVATEAEFVPIKVGDSDPLQESYCQYVLSGQIPEIVDDSHVVPILKALRTTDAMEIRAYMGVPIRLSDGSVFGTFCCYSRRPRMAIRNIDKEAMYRFADIIAVLLEERIYNERAVEAKSAVISEALHNHAMHMVYQPIVDLVTKKVLGYEALARFATQPERGPDQWFADAHTIERGPELEKVAIGLAIRDLEHLSPDTYLALNVSPYTLLSGCLDELLLSAPWGRIVIELTEHVPVLEYEVLAQWLEPFRKRGVKLAIDDAGSGYASFRHILQLKPDFIKLDHTLIRQIDRDQVRRALALALITFSNETGCRIIAEGVETEEEMDALLSVGVKFAQGYLLGRPSRTGSVRI